MRYPIAMFKCPKCEELHDGRVKALLCCEVVIPLVYLCYQCREQYDSHRDANRCCQEEA